MKIALLLSGGVDSSVALALLKDAGHEVTAFYIKIWLEDELSFLGQCPWEEDLQFARGVCEKLEVPLEIVSLQREYYERVVSYALQELKSGRTPSPDIFCNQRIKFGAFFDKIGTGYEKVASGHYAQLEERGNEVLLKTCPDPVKDQTYFLSHLSGTQMGRLLFPIGGFYKKEVRELAQKYNLPNQNRKDSQGICFLGKIKYPEFVKHHLGEKKGDIVEQESGKKYGEHFGYWYHTIGQRQGLGLSGGPWYVVAKDCEKNIVYISHSFEKKSYTRHSFTVGECNWIHEAPQGETLRIKIRHGPTFYHGRILWEKEDFSVATVEMQEADPGIAAGQFAVFYEDDTCLGCAKILG